jgi:uncharacterized protein YbjT (DUF2867 family)
VSGDLVTVFGGSGFIGKQVVRALAKQGYRVRVAMRRPHLGHELRVMGDVGQVQLVQANVRFPESVDVALEGADAVVNLVAVLYERGKQSFDELHVEAARTIAEAAAKRGIKRIVHVSALGAAPKGSKYQRSKYAGERAILEAAPTATILRPSIVFGPEDSFFNRFAGMIQWRSTAPPPFNILPLPGNKTKLQPIFVGDVADAVAAAVANANTQGRVYELGGPRTYTFRQLIDYVRAETDRSVPVLPLASYIAHPAGVLANAVFSFLPWAPPLTGDQVFTLKRDNVVGADPNALTIQDLGITQLESVEAIVPDYLWRFRPYGQFQTRQNPA